MIKSDNKIYQDMVRGMMGLQVPSGGSVAFATESGPEGQDDQGKVRWIIIYNDVSNLDVTFTPRDGAEFWITV